MTRLFTFIFTPYVFALGISLLSATAIGSALTAQYAFDLAPCILCIYQRVPFVVTFLLGLTAYKLFRQDRPRGALLMIALSGLVFLGNSVLAFYHVGVEQHWWASAFEACVIDPTNIREAALNPPVPCDKIPWQLFGISMAGYNVLICGIAGVTCLIYSLIRKSKIYTSSSSVSQ